MTRKLILFGIKERLKIYAGIVLLYLFYLVVNVVDKPALLIGILGMERESADALIDAFFRGPDILGVRIIVASFVLLGMSAAALLLAEIFIFVRDFYSPHAYLLFSLPVNGRNVVGSRFGLFILDALLLVVLDLPVRLPFYRTLISSVTSGEIGSFSPGLTTSEFLYFGLLAGATWISIFTAVPLLAYMLIAVAKCLLDLSAGWLTAFVALGYGAFLGMGYVIGLAMPPLIHMPSSSTMYETNPFIPVLLLASNVLLFWSGAMVIDRRLNI